MLEFYVFRHFWPILAHQKPLLWHVWDSRWSFLPFWSTHFATSNSQWRPLWDSFGHPALASLTLLGPCWKTTEKQPTKITFVGWLVEAFCGRWHMQSVHACAVQTHILHLILTPLVERQKYQKIETVLDPRQGTFDTSQIRGELVDNLLLVVDIC